MKCEICGDEEATTVVDDSIDGITWEVCRWCNAMFDELDGYDRGLSEKMNDIDDNYFEWG